MSEIIHALYVDDEPELLSLGKQLLEGKGDIRVTPVTSAIEALSWINNQTFDIIISDDQMPDMDGISFLKRIRENDDQIPFILLTEIGREEVVIEALNYSADFCVQKGGEPKVQFAELSHKIHQAVHQKSVTQNNFLHIFNQIITTANRSENISTLLHDILKSTLTLMDYDAGGIYLTDHEAGTATVVESQHLPPDFLEEIRTVSIHDSPYVNLLKTGSPIFTEHYEKLSPGRSRETGFLSLASVPLWSKNDIVGALNVISKKRHHVTKQERETLVSIGRELGTTIQRMGHEQELIQRNDELEAAYEELAGSEEELRHQYELLTQTAEHHRKTIELLENLIAIAHVPIIVWDSEYKIVRINHIIERITGRTLEDCIRAPLQSLFSPDQADRVNRLLETTQSGVKWENVELPVLHQDGTLRTILWNTSTLFDIDGITPVATLAQGKDVTDERRYGAEKDAALVEIQKNIAQLAILNDEIRNPLMVIVTCADLLGNEELLDQIMVQAQRIDGMVNSLDRRWAESEKVLNAIRKHYQIEVFGTGDSEPETESDRYNQDPGTVNSSGDVYGAIPLMEEVQAQLYTILDSIDALVYVADMQTYDLLYINQRGRSFLGNIVGKKCYQALFSGQENPCSFCTNSHLMHNSRPTGVYRWEFEDTKSGRWFDCRDRAIRWSDGRWVRLEIATDITKRKRIERSLQEKDEKYRLLADNIGDVIWTAGRDMNLTYVSPSITVLTGYTVEEFMDLPIYESLTQVSLSRLIRSREISMQTVLFEDLKHLPPMVLELDYRTKEGNIVPTETTISLIFSEDGGVQGVVGVTRDITARKEAETAIRENERRYREIFESLEDLYYQTDENGIITVLSPSVFRLSGWMAEDLIGTPVQDLYVHPEDRSILLSELSKNGCVKDYELLLKKKDGTPIPISLSGNIINKPDGTKGGLRGSLRDITERKQAEKKLIATLQTSQDIVQSIPSGIFIYKFEEPDRLILIDGNQEAERLTGIIIQDWIGREFNEIWPAARKSGLTDAYLNAYHTGVLFETEDLNYQDLRLSGAFRIKAFLIPDNRFVVAFEDITDKKSYELVLAESERNYREIFNSTTEAIMIDDASTGKIIDMNESTLKMYGYDTKEEILAGNIGDLSANLHPYDEAEAQRRIEKCIEEGSQVFEWLAKKKSGEVFWVEVSLRRSEIGGHGRILAVVRDITRRKKAEESLRKLTERLLQIDSSTLDAIYAYDTEGRFTHANRAQCELLGLSRDEIIGKTHQELGFPENICHEWALFFQDVYASDTTVIREIVTPIENGPMVFSEVVLNPIHNETGGIVGISGITRNTTERKQAEEALYASNQKLRLLTSLTRHDVTNRLNAIHLFHDICLQETDPAKRDEFLIQASQATEEAEAIIRFTQEYEDFGIVASRWQQVQCLILHASSEVVHSGIIIETSNLSAVQIFADPIIQKVFSTLIENAIRHGEHISRIMFSCIKEGQGIVIVCQDDGCGIATHEKEKIFDHGYGKNTGLGLFLAREILAITGLSIRETGIPGKGARFEIFVPEGKWQRMQ